MDTQVTENHNPQTPAAADPDVFLELESNTRAFGSSVRDLMDSVLAKISEQEIVPLSRAQTHSITSRAVVPLVLQPVERVSLCLLEQALVMAILPGCWSGGDQATSLSAFHAEVPTPLTPTWAVDNCQRVEKLHHNLRDRLIQYLRTRDPTEPVPEYARLSPPENPFQMEFAIMRGHLFVLARWAQGYAIPRENLPSQLPLVHCMGPEVLDQFYHELDTPQATRCWGVLRGVAAQ